MKQALIIAASPEENIDYIQAVYEKLEDPLVICADGGMKKAQQLSIPCDLLMGDMDSGGTPVNCAAVRFPAEKNYTDSQACLEEAIARGCDRLYLTGASGGRVDHFLCNLHLLEATEKKGAETFLIDARNEVQLLKNQIYRIPAPYRYFSLIPITETLEGVLIRNAKYPLENAFVRREDSLTVSNEPKENREVEITVQKGKAFLIFSK